jgi:hypothetical protein
MVPGEKPLSPHAIRKSCLTFRAAGWIFRSDLKEKLEGFLARRAKEEVSFWVPRIECEILAERLACFSELGENPGFGEFGLDLSGREVMVTPQFQ